MIDLLKYLPALTPIILIGALVLGWTSRGKIQEFLENLVDNHVHTIVGELGRDISAQLINQTDHRSNKLDETANKIVSALIRPPQ